MGKEGVASFIKVEDKEIQFIEIERTILLEAINVTWKTAPHMIIGSFGLRGREGSWVELTGN